MKKLVSSVAIVAVLGLPGGAYAATSQAVPHTDTWTIRGVISSIDGKWDLTVHDNEGFNHTVVLHRGTIIHPTGLQLQPGMRISVLGYENQANFDANEIVGPTDLALTPHGGGRVARTTLVPEEIPNGDFQTDGPTAVGGG